MGGVARTLVVHPGALGDVLLAVPALRALRAGAPCGRLVLAAHPGIATLLHALGVVDDGIAFDRLELDALFVDDGGDGADVLARFDRVVCWFGSSDPLFRRRLGAIVADPIVAPSTSADRPVWEHLLSTVGGTVPMCAPLEVPARLAEAGRVALMAAGWDVRTPLAMIHPGGSGAAKRWPVDGFAEAVKALAQRGLAVVAHEGPLDAGPVGDLLARVGATLIRLDNPSLPVLAGALGHAAVYVGNDSGVSHLAAAIGTRAIVLFTRALLRWRPWIAAVDTVVVSTATTERGDVDRIIDAIARVEILGAR